MRVEVDTRPLPIVLLSRGWRPIVFLIVLALFIGILKAPTPAGLSPEGQRAIAVFAVCLILWVTHVIPLMITSLLAIILLPLLGILTTSQAYALFGNYAVFFILGAFILTAAMMKSGLSSRISLWVLRKMGRTPDRLLLGIFLSGAVFSFFMSEHAVAAMMFPVVLEIAHGLGLAPFRSRYGASLFVAMAWGTVVGGILTLLGGARAPLALGILHETTGRSVGFFQWTAAVFPLVAALLGVTYWVIRRTFRAEEVSIQKAQDILEKKIAALGRISSQEKGIGAIMLATIGAWIFWGEKVGLANIAIASVVVLFIFQLVRWRDVEEYVNWGIILMYGGAIALGYALDKSGAAAWAANATIGQFAHNPLAVLASFSLVAIVLTEGMSNSAVVAILLPVGLGLARAFSLDVRAITLGIAIPAGLNFFLPMSTPGMAIAYSSQYLRVRDVAFAGLLLDLVAWALFMLLAAWYWPLIGLGVQ